MNVNATKCAKCGQAITMVGICYACGSANEFPLHVAPEPFVPYPAADDNSREAGLKASALKRPSKDFQADKSVRLTPIRQAEPAARTMLRILFATTCTLIALTAIVRPDAITMAQNAPKTTYYSPTIPKIRWESVSKDFIEMGASVRAYNEDQPNMMAVRLQRPAVMDKSMAFAIVRSAQKRLGFCSVVSLRDASGKLLALGTDYGVK